MTKHSARRTSSWRLGTAVVVAMIAALVSAIASPTVASATTPPSIAYVVNSGGSTVTPLHRSTAGTAVAGSDIPVGNHPNGIAMAPDGATVYVINSEQNTVTPIDTATNTPGTPITVPSPVGIAISPDSRTAFVASQQGQAVVVPINLETMTAETSFGVGSGVGLGGFAMTPNGRTGYVGRGNLVDIVKFDTAARSAAAAIPVSACCVFAVSPDSSTLYVAGAVVQRINTGDDTFGTPIEFGNQGNEQFRAMAITPDGATAYVTSKFGYVVPFTLATNTRRPIIIIGGAPTGIAITADGTTAYVTDNASNTVTPIDTATDTPGAPIAVGSTPGAIAVMPAGSSAKAASATTMSSTPNPSQRFDAVTLTAEVKPASTGGSGGTPTGSVTFGKGAGSTTQPLGTATLDAEGKATLITSDIPVGPQPIVAAYGGDTAFEPSTSGVVQQSVSKVGTATAVSASNNPSAHAVFTVTVTKSGTNAAGTPSGSVVLFCDGSQVGGSRNLDAAGHATFTNSLAFKGLGAHTITVEYEGSADFAQSTSAPLGHTVMSRADTATALVVDPLTSTHFAPVTFAATVTNADGSPAPTGSIQLMDGPNIRQIQPLDASGRAVFSTSLAAGEHTITAKYLGDPEFFNGSTSPPIAYVVSKDSSTTQLTSSPNPSTLGATATFTATVTNAFEGSVRFLEGTTLLGTSELGSPFPDRTARFSTDELSAGDHTIIAEYVGNADYEPSTSSALVHHVSILDEATVIELTSSPNPSEPTEAVTITATVTKASGDIPTGLLKLRDGPTQFTEDFLDGQGRMTFTTDQLTLGTHVLTATYVGDAFSHGSTAQLTHRVSGIATSTALTSTPDRSFESEPVTFTATVVATSGRGPSLAGHPVNFMEGSGRLFEGILGEDGRASFTTDSLSPGDHPITAGFPNLGSFWEGSTSAPIVHTVTARVDTVTVLGSGPNPSTPNQTVTFSAVVMTAPGQHTSELPAGELRLMEGSTVLGSALVDASGLTVFTVSDLPDGAHTIQAVYAGDSNFRPSTAQVVHVVDARVNSTTAVTSSPNPSESGQNATFTVTVGSASGDSPIPTGSVRVFTSPPSTFNETAVLDSQGRATANTSDLAPGDHSVRATYLGDDVYRPSAAPGLAHTVDLVRTTTALASSPVSSEFGDAVTFRATVVDAISGTPVPVGSVVFTQGSTHVGNLPVNDQGVATFTTSNLSVGNTVVRASFAGGATREGSSATLTYTVHKIPTATVLTSSPNPSGDTRLVTLTATVARASGLGAGPQTGRIEFRDGSTILGTEPFSLAPADEPHGATLTLPNLAVGAHTITATFGSNLAFADSTSVSLTHEVKVRDEVTVQLVSSPNPSSRFEPVTYAATVTKASGAGAVPTGKVRFTRANAAPLVVDLNAEGHATTAPITVLPAGTNFVTATYDGDDDFKPGTSTLTHTVVLAATVTTLESSPNPSFTGQGISLTATVKLAPGLSGPIPTSGTVVFKEGPTQLVGQALDPEGRATVTLPARAVGTYTFTAHYRGGSGAFEESISAGHIHTVLPKVASTTALVSNLNPSPRFETVAFTVTVRRASGSGAIPTGSVFFKNGSANIGTRTLDAQGQATLLKANLPAGTHSIKVLYDGDAEFNPSTSGTVSQLVTKAATTSVVVSSPNPSARTAAATFTVTVAKAAGAVAIPTGSVTFKNGSASIGTRTLDAQGRATLIKANLPPGAHVITVAYAGSSDFSSSTSPTLTHTVAKTPTFIGLASSLNPSGRSRSVTFTAVVVTPLAGATASGTVRFNDGPTLLSSQHLNNRGEATFTTSSLALGDHTITAVYVGNADFDASTSAATTQSVVKTATSTVLASSVNPSRQSRPVTFTATVMSALGGNPKPTGSVTFKNGSTVLGTGTVNGQGRATFTTSSLALGKHTITAVYAGDGNLESSSSKGLAHSVS